MKLIRWSSAALLIIAALAQAAPQEDAARARVDELMNQGLVVAAQLDEAGVIAQLGAPVARDEGQSRNRSSGYTDKIVALHYPGLDVDIYTLTHPTRGWSRVSKVRVTGTDYPLPLGLAIGMEENEVRKILGKPAMTNPALGGTEWLYFPSSDDQQRQLVVRMARKKIAEIAWYCMAD